MLRNTQNQFGAVTKTLHWLTVLLISTVIPLGLIANNLAHRIEDPQIAATADDIARAALLFSLHKTIGVTIFFVALIRIGWALFQPRPGLLNADKRLESTLAETVHWLLYGSLLLVPLTGWIHHAATEGFAPIWWLFGQSLPFVPKDAAVAEIFADLHLLLERVLVVAVLLHVAGALKHHLIDKDTTLRRMLPGRTASDTAPERRGSFAPPALALAVWAAVLGTASMTGAIGVHESEAPEVPALEAVETDWQVQSGSLGLTIRQLGSDVAGEFADWTAAITFDARVEKGIAGSVSVTVSIGSLALGSVTGQALGADFFNASEFPTATFDAEIERIGDAYVARGPLRIRDRSVPIELPFTLMIDGAVATMTGSTTLNRLDFGVGQSVSDEASLAFAVDIDVELIAEKIVP